MTSRRLVLMMCVGAYLLQATELNADRPATTQGAPVTSADDRVRALRATVEALQEKAFRDDPRLAEAEEGYQVFQKKNTKLQGDRINAYKLLTNPEEKSEYEILMERWRYIYHLELIADEKRSIFLRFLLTSDNDTQSQSASLLLGSFPELAGQDLTNPDVFWTAYSTKLPPAAKQIQARFDEAAKASPFPQFVIEQAKIDVEQQVDAAMYRAYMRIKTPEELVKARFELKQAIVDARKPNAASNSKGTK